MSKNLVLLAMCALGHLATADAWTEVGDRSHPNCAQKSCSVNEGSTSFEIGMEIEAKDDLEYLTQLVIRNRKTGQAQSFDTSAVNGAENHQPFNLYQVRLQSPNVIDLALRAYTSARAGPSYYYFLFDAKTQTFVQTEDTVPKLNVDPKTKELRTDIQEVPFKIVNHRLTEK